MKQMPRGITNLVFTALPGGVVENASGRWLALSAFLTPRLRRHPSVPAAAPIHLRDFPDLVNWQRKAPTLNYQLDFLGRSGETARRRVFVSRTRDGGPAGDGKAIILRPDRAEDDVANPWIETLGARWLELWPMLFPPDTEVEPAEESEQSTPAATSSFNGEKVEKAISQKYVEAQQNTTPPREQDSAVAREVEDYNSQISKKVQEGATPIMEFHTQCSALGEYPSLLRQLYLILDFWVPWVPEFEQEGELEWGRVFVSPVWEETESRRFISAPTAFILEYRADRRPYLFRARLREEADPAAVPLANRRFRENLLNLKRTQARAGSAVGDEVFSVGQIDPLAGYQQVVAPNGGRPDALPTPVRSAGLGLYQRDLEQEVNEALSADTQRVAWFDTQANDDSYLARKRGKPSRTLGGARIVRASFSEDAEGNGSAEPAWAAPHPALAGPEVFYAEDLIAGYRVDLGLQTRGVVQRWFSLNERVGRYRVGDTQAPAAQLPEVRLPDEGFISFAALQTSSDPGRRIFAFPNSLFRWDGWSLSVPRPGPVLTTEGRVGAATTEVPRRPEQLQQGSARMNVTFNPVPRSLPRLRFGASYRFRLRPVDLAGNSHTLRSADAMGAWQNGPDQGLYDDYYRFEPVPAPLFVPDKEMAAGGQSLLGESLDCMVFRSREDGSLRRVECVRHLAPPPAPLRLVECHGQLEKWLVPGEQPQGFGSEAQYRQLAVRSSWQAPAWLPASNNDPRALVNFLPDPMAQGVQIWNLPPPSPGGVALRDEIKFYGGSAKWPDARPWKLVLGFSGLAGNLPETVPPLDSADISWPGVLEPDQAEARLQLKAHGRAEVETLLPALRVAYLQAADTVSRAVNERSFSDVDYGRRELRIWLAPGRSATICISSLLAAEELKLLGVYQRWLRHILTDDNEIMRKPNELLRPSQEIRLVHAVPRPVFAPLLLTLPEPEPRFRFFNQRDLPVVGLKAEPSHFVKIRRVPFPEQSEAGGVGDAERQEALRLQAQDSLGCEVVAAVFAPSASAQKLEVTANWTEVVDDSQIRPAVQERKALVFTQSIGGEPAHCEPGASGQDFRETRDGVVPLAGRHEFNDTRQRFVRYTVTAHNRYGEFFPGQEGYTTRSAEPGLMDGARTDGAAGYIAVPSAKRPSAPEVAFVLPIFRSDPAGPGESTARQATEARQKEYVRYRRGGGLRVYLRRPWFESGADECLGVVLRNDRTLPGAEDDQNGDADPCSPGQGARSKVSLWGQDPIRAASPVGPLRADVFRNARGQGVGDGSRRGEGLYFAPTVITPRGEEVSVVAYPMTLKENFDEVRNLYFVDIILDNPGAYFPFIRLALCRYQPFSLQGLETSEIAIADIIQLAPDRTASIVFDNDFTTCNVSLYGNMDLYFGPRAENLVEVQVEVPRRRIEDAQREEMLSTNLYWESLGAPQPLALQAEGPNPYWHGVVDMSRAFLGGHPDSPRLVFREYEVYQSEGGEERRLVYADSIWVNRTATQ